MQNAGIFKVFKNREMQIREIQGRELQGLPVLKSYFGILGILNYSQKVMKNWGMSFMDVHY